MLKKIKILSKILEWVVFVVLLVILGLVISPNLPFKNIPKSFVVVSGSMEPAIHTGSIAFVRTVDPKTVKKGDIVAFTSPSNSKDTILHRVDSIKTTDPLTFSTKGDANNSPDAWDVMDVGVKGVYFGAVPFLGYVGAFVKKPLGFGIVIGIPALLFIISQLFSIKKTINEEVDRKVAKALETKKKTKSIEGGIRSLILFIVLFPSLIGLSTLQTIKASFSSTVTVSGISLSVVDFIPPSIPTNLHWSNPDVTCGGSTNSYTVTAVWDASTAHESKHVDHYEYESFNPTTGWMWGPTNVTATQRAGEFSVGAGTYGFRIRAIDNLGYASDWTSADFATSCQITYTPVPPAPTLISPANNSAVNTNGLIMDWADVTGDYNNPLYYIYQSARNPEFSPVAYTSNHLTISQIPAPGTSNGDYWWHVKTCDASNNCSNWSEVWKMTVDSTAPTSIITYPLNSDSDNIIEDVYLWNGRVEGTASDNLSGINRVELSIYHRDLDLYWNGNNWIHGSETGTRVSANGTTSWSYQLNSQPPLGQFLIISHAFDNAGNQENSATIEFDNKDSSTLSSAVSPSAQMTLSADQKYILFVVNNIKTFKSMSYQLTYDTSTVPAGITGSNIDITGNSYSSGDIPLGTCSTGGMCVFSQGVKNFQLSVSLTDQNGVTTIVTTSL